MQKSDLACMSWREAAELFSKVDTVLLPVGSVEQHGPHNPLGTDYLIAAALAAEAGRRAGVPVLPVVPYGVSVHHSAFPGTIWVREEVLKEYLRDVIRSLKQHGVRKVVVVNGHGGNLQAIMSLAREMRQEGVLVVAYQWWTLPELGKLFSKEELGHAAAVETSLNLYLNASCVDISKAVDEQPASLPTDGLGYFPDFTHDRTKSGVFGTATTSSREKGAEVFRLAVEALVKLVEQVRSMKV